MNQHLNNMIKKKLPKKEKPVTHQNETKWYSEKVASAGVNRSQQAQSLLAALNLAVFCCVLQGLPGIPGAVGVRVSCFLPLLISAGV